MTGLEELAALWRQARRVVVLTGAGLSTASGIPDFRSPGGRWERYRPVPLPEFLADEGARERYWRYKGETWQLIRTALPNAGHRALTDLAVAGRLHLLVTQNVDGLHERSGFPRERLVAIHGTDSEVECMACHRRAERAVAQDAWEAGRLRLRSEGGVVFEVDGLHDQDPLPHRGLGGPAAGHEYVELRLHLEGVNLVPDVERAPLEGVRLTRPQEEVDHVRAGELDL